MRSVGQGTEEDEEQRFIAAYPALRRLAFVLADRGTDPDDLLHEALVRR